MRIVDGTKLIEAFPIALVVARFNQEITKACSKAL